MRDLIPDKKLKIFLSYSRRDAAEFADELVAGLELAGFAPFLDRHDIVAGEDWEARLGRLIEQSDTVVFVVTPEAVKSERCKWEVDRTLALSKRLLPVIHKPAPNADIPLQLSRLQFVRFDTGRALNRSLAELTEALRVDLDWIREHTRLGELVARWSARERPESLLLRGDDLDAAKAWEAMRKAGAPEITEPQRAFIAASEIAERARLNRERAQRDEVKRQQKRSALLLSGVSVLLIAIVVGGVGVINQEFVKDQFNWYRTMRPYGALNFDPYVLKPERESALKSGEAFRECRSGYCPQMIVVPAGEFIMGSPETETGHQPIEGPQHKVTIARPFAVSKFDVTVIDWDTCAFVGGCPQLGRHQPAKPYEPVAFPRTGTGLRIIPETRSRPVTDMSWEDAKTYVAWLSRMVGKPYRLLTDAEYEYAARAGTQTAYPWGDDIGKDNANCKLCGSKWDGREIAVVGSFAANTFGLYDMVGNVWKWVEDCNHDSYDGAPIDGSAWATGDCKFHMRRGGAYLSTPRVLRSAHRIYTSTGDYTNMGFRVARTLGP